MVNIANDTNKGFLLAVVLVLALAIFSGSLRDRYSSGYAVASSPVDYYATNPESTRISNSYGFGSNSGMSQAISLCKEKYFETDYNSYLECRNQVLRESGVKP